MNLQNTIQTAKDLLGMHLVHETAQGKMVGRIVETEAYLADDPAAHSFSGKTKRNASMFGPAGIAYVYMIYGVYYCINLVTSTKAEAVLIRAVEPIEGIEIMRKHRQTSDAHLTSGPGKLCIAMQIHKKHDGKNLLDATSPLRIEAGSEQNFSIVSATRIGITKAKERPHRFYIEGNAFVSKK
jgi:DNA-3-methyladenine glycosylase